MAKKNTSAKKKGNHQKKKLISNIPQKKEEKKLGDGIVEYEDGITVGELAEMIGQTPANVIKSFIYAWNYGDNQFIIN